MFKHYNKHEMITQFALKIVRMQLDFEKTDDLYTLPTLGLCYTYRLPIRHIDTNLHDVVIGFLPVEFDWCKEPLYYAFLSEMNVLE